MKMKHVYLFLCLSASLLLRPPTAESKKITVKELFDHEMHTENFFTPNNVPCENCHIDNQYEWRGMNHDGCHDCHKRSKFLDYAPKDCSRCHDKLQVKPTSHKADWLSRHKVEAKADEKFCKTCHNDRFCIKCHHQRTDIQLNMHKRNYKYFHSIEARADPKKCDTCHQVSFCTGCHTNSRKR